MIRSSGSTTHVDAAYCYRPRFVGLSVCHSSEPCKNAEPIEIPFGLWAPMGPKNHVLDGGPDPHSPWEGAIGNFKREKGRPLKIVASLCYELCNKSSAVAEMGVRARAKAEKWGWGCCAPLGGEAGSPSNTMWPDLRPTFVPSGILIHPVVWTQ